MTGDEVRQVFEAMLPQDAIDRLCQECGVIERQRQLHLEMLVRAMVISAGPRQCLSGRHLALLPGV